MKHIQTAGFESVKIEIFDTTMRDGAQALPEENQFPPGSKIELAEKIVSLGVDTIEAGFPATMGDSEEIKEVAKIVGRNIYEITPMTINNGIFVPLERKIWTPVITGLTLARPSGVEEAYSAVEAANRPGIHIFVASAEEHMRAKHPGMTQDEILQMGIEAIRHARDVGGPRTRIEFSLEAASTTHPKILEKFVKAILQEDINVLNLPDTLGAASPKRIRKIFSDVTRWMIQQGRNEDVIISCHNHNDGERAVQNSIEALHAVIDTAVAMDAKPPIFQTEVTSGHNLGERNGNTNLAPFARNVLTDRSEFGLPVLLQVNTQRLKTVAEFIAQKAGLTLDPNASVVGRDTVANRAGVHSDAIIKGGAAIYAAVDNRGFGHEFAARNERGKYQGRSGNNNEGGTEIYRSELVMTSADIMERIRTIGMEVNDDQLERITVASNTSARKNKRPNADTEIERLVANETKQQIIDAVVLNDFSESDKSADGDATVRLNTPSGFVVGRARRITGGIGALIHATNDALGFDGDYEKWMAHSVGEGSDAIGSISLVVKQNGYRVSSVAQSPDVNNASLCAYIDAINLIRRIENRVET